MYFVGELLCHCGNIVRAHQKISIICILHHALESRALVEMWRSEAVTSYDGGSMTEPCRIEAFIIAIIEMVSCNLGMGKIIGHPIIYVFHSFIHSKICIAPLQGNYSEALPTRSSDDWPLTTAQVLSG